MNITLDDLIAKHNACVNALDESRTCSTCAYEQTAIEMKPCNECFNEILGMPVNPTNWLIKSSV
jgi:hypothetical protein